MDAEMRRLKLPTHGSKEHGRKLRVVITPVKEVLKTRLRGLGEAYYQELLDRIFAARTCSSACMATRNIKCKIHRVYPKFAS
jgi:hypothetical protein